MKEMPADEVRDLKRSLDEDGYVVIRDVVSKERLAELADAVGQELERAKRDGELFHGGGSLSGHLNSFPGEGSRFVYDDIAERGILDLARAVDEEKAERLRVTMNYNLPGSDAQFYHIDDLFSEAFLICNVAVVDTDVTNGAIDLLPGTNDRFYRFWEYAVQRKYRLTTADPDASGRRAAADVHPVASRDAQPVGQGPPDDVDHLRREERAGRRPVHGQRRQDRLHAELVQPEPHGPPPASGRSSRCRGRTRATASPGPCGATGATPSW